MNEQITVYNGKNKTILNSIFVFDSSEPSNCQAFHRLPSMFQDFITEKHCSLVNYAKSTLEPLSLRPIITSGFRSATVNKANKGVVDSLHLHGLAIDFVPINKYNTICLDKSLIEYFKNDLFTILFENSHFHLQFNRKR